MIDLALVEIKPDDGRVGKAPRHLPRPATRATRHIHNRLGIRDGSQHLRSIGMTNHHMPQVQWI
jgi:hypothetical protein